MRHCHCQWVSILEAATPDNPTVFVPPADHRIALPLSYTELEESTFTGDSCRGGATTSTTIATIAAGHGSRVFSSRSGGGGSRGEMLGISAEEPFTSRCVYKESCTTGTRTDLWMFENAARDEREWRCCTYVVSQQRRICPPLVVAMTSFRPHLFNQPQTRGHK